MPGTNARDWVSRVFPPPVCDGWRDNPEMADVLAMASAPPLVSGESFSVDQLWSLVQRTATNAYLEAAHKILQGRLRRDLWKSLRASNPHNHRAAMAECIAAWWFTEVLGLRLLPRPSGKGRKKLDFAIEDPRIGLEVKAPYRPMRYRPGQIVMRDPGDTDHMGAVVTCLGDAEKQLDPAQLNVVVLVPSLDFWILRAVIRALEEGAFSADAVVVIERLSDLINPTDGNPGEAFVTHGCRIVRNRKRPPFPDALWRGWPVYEGPDFDLSHEKLAPVSGAPKEWARTPSVFFNGQRLTLAPVTEPS